MSIQNKLNEYRLNGYFIDYELKCGEKTFKCHKILLAKNSTLFKEIFSKKSDEQVEIADCYESEFESIMESVYTNKLEFTQDNVVKILGFALAYGFKSITNTARTKMTEFLQKSKDKVLEYSEQMVEFNISDEESNRAIQKIICDNFDNYDIDSLLDKITSTCLYLLLSSDKLKVRSDDYRLALIDLFHERRPITDQKIRYDLANLFDFHPETNESAYKFIINHKCMWAPEELTIKLYRIAIKNRLQIARQYSEATNTFADTKSRWIDFQWCSQIHNSEISEDSIKIELVSFARTFGGFIDAVNPRTFGLIGCSSSTPFGFNKNKNSEYKCQFSSSGIFMDDNRYFASMGDAYIEVNFGEDSSFKISKIEIQSLPKSVGEFKWNKFPLKFAEIKNEEKIKNEENQVNLDETEIMKKRLGVPESLDVLVNDKCAVQNVKFERNGEEKVFVWSHTFDDETSNKVRIAMSKNNNAGGKVLRIGLIKIYGHFV
ncbi:BTB/POZ domain containing protein [Trichomonas vaginalis G3]|uniref:BTB/POZ domain containing protein n=1 Tax=Trichomonas vaginalis (strain ATCC PRA-98 / G3) TaxID=412133 RepID=A2EWL2_TRIV3|nr:Potassium Channel Kv1.1, Chain A domain-containing protein [Trichomonas vaginalis G3]EAY02966.1 BTB/POZ domain containing protein [Trichomonas vaginalis G3]KAI5492193.1 Potassium Channel Kv1.1, Chain A domain-containing protein [Trichomonas vaginalis G3]|eukprot:XP_001315189.1 BTB/POZ domain containing protein [Trichomonas vaginalis G3]